MQLRRVFIAMALLRWPRAASVSSRHHDTARHRYTIEGTTAAMEAALQTPHARLDIRSITALSSTTTSSSSEHLVHEATTNVRADVVGLKQDVDAFAAAGSVQHSSTLSSPSAPHGRRSPLPGTVMAPLTVLKHKGLSVNQVIAKDRRDVSACRDRTKGYLDDLKTKHADPALSATVVYTASRFFDCFRPSHEVFAFLDTVTEQNPDVLTKYANVSTTYEGRAIPAFKISTTGARAQATPCKKTLYTQALLHAREWQAGAATVYTMASMVDDIRARDTSARSLFDKFDWYFVPIVNMDGYDYTWKVDRMWRTNRHVVKWNGQDVGVDLNRNWPPAALFNGEPRLVDRETYPGAFPLSEASTAGLFAFLQTLSSLSGILDMHTFGGQVLRPFSNQPGSGAEPFGSRMQTLANSVRNALSTVPSVQYQSKPGLALYRAYGCFDDAMFLAFNLTVPALTIEVEGSDFVAPQASIRSVGANIHLGLRQFAQEALEYTQL